MNHFQIRRVIDRNTYSPMTIDDVADYSRIPRIQFQRKPKICFTTIRSYGKI